MNMNSSGSTPPENIDGNNNDQERLFIDQLTGIELGYLCTSLKDSWESP